MGSLLLLGMLLAPAVTRADEKWIGKPAPAIAAAEWLNSKPLDLAKSKGKVVVVEFWATWCGPCKASIPHLSELHKKYGPKGVQFASLTNEDAATVKPFVEKNKAMDYPIGLGSKADEAFKVTTIPQAFIIGKDGKVVWQGRPLEDGFEKGIEQALK